MYRRGTYTVPQHLNSKDKGEEEEEDLEETDGGNNMIESISGTVSCCFGGDINLASCFYLINEDMRKYSRKYRYSFGQLPAWAKRQVSIAFSATLCHIFFIVIMLL